jgi:septal ring factor EnvC (AmiA/AmiB activator)
LHPAGTLTAAPNPRSMSEHEPHVSGQELRAALAQSGRSRPNPLMAQTEPVWEWTTDEQAELEELRETAAELESQLDRLRGVAADARASEHEARRALRQLADARPWKRRAVVAELAGRGLL